MLFCVMANTIMRRLQTGQSDIKTDQSQNITAKAADFQKNELSKNIKKGEQKEKTMAEKAAQAEEETTSNNVYQRPLRS